MTTPARFNDRVVLVTGGGSGIGRAIAVAFAREGATVVVAGRDTGRLDETVAEIAADAGGTASAVAVDITNSEDVERMLGEVIRDHGRLDVAVNNAGVLRTGPIGDLADADWDATVDTNLTGMFRCLRGEIRVMRAAGGGTIVNISSNVGAHVRRPGTGAYAASKAAVSVLTRVAALDHIGDGVRINAVSPGPTDTAMSFRPGETPADRAARLRATNPIGRVGERREIADAVLWLASEQSSYVVGHDLVVDGGASA